MEMKVPVLLITGSLGAGKTTIGSEVSELLERAGLPHAYIDIDTLRWGYFPLCADRFQRELAMKNLAALWINFQQAGAYRLIISDVIEERRDLQYYREAVPGAHVFVVRLRASFVELERRLKNREVGSGLDRHLERTAELARKLEQAGVEDLVIDTDGKSVTAIAWEVLQECGWMDAEAKQRG